MAARASKGSGDENAPDLGLEDAGFPAKAPAADQPHHLGHRERLRARFEEGGLSAVQDYELLELCLFRVLPRQDVKALAKALIARFHDFAGVLAAAVEALAEVKGVKEKTARELKLLHAVAQKVAQDRAKARKHITSWRQLVDYFNAHMTDRGTEEFRVLFLDKRNTLLRDEVMGQGTVDQAPVYPREVAARALALNATAVILAHNHPSGDPTPSHADIEMTKAVVAALKPLGIVVHDHVVVAREQMASFRELGLL